MGPFQFRVQPKSEIFCHVIHCPKGLQTKPEGTRLLVIFDKKIKETLLHTLHIYSCSTVLCAGLHFARSLAPGFIDKWQHASAWSELKSKQMFIMFNEFKKWYGKVVCHNIKSKANTIVFFASIVRFEKYHRWYRQLTQIIKLNSVEEQGQICLHCWMFVKCGNPRKSVRALNKRMLEAGAFWSSGLGGGELARGSSGWVAGGTAVAFQLQNHTWWPSGQSPVGAPTKWITILLCLKAWALWQLKTRFSA